MAETSVNPTPSYGLPISGQQESASVTYESLLSSNTRWAMSEGSLFFEGKGRVQETLSRITRKLDELEIPYALVGGLALFQHGYRRFTEDVDILVTKDSLIRIHKELEGRGFVRPFEHSKNLRDAATGVRVEFLITGGFPGDGQPKSVSFPDPSNVAEVRDGIRVLRLPKIIELKLASGMSSPDRGKDLADVEELIKSLHLTRDVGSHLDASVASKYFEIWDRIHGVKRRYVRLWRNKWLTAEAKNLEELVTLLRRASEELDAMRRDGVILDSEGGTSDDYAMLVTTDPEVAHRYGMVEESEFFGDFEEDDEEEGKSDSH